MITREDYKFRQEICIPCYNTDASFRLKPAAFMDMAQEIAFWAAQALGFGYDSLHEHNVAWVLTRMHIHFHAYPRWRDNVSLYTWHKGLGGLYFLRDFLLHDSTGGPLARCTSSWVIINEKTRRLVRPEELADVLAVDYPVEDAIAAAAPKLTLPSGTSLEKVHDHVVGYSDIDIIGHSNNVRYVVWAMDALPYEQTKKEVRDLYINFIKETTQGQTVSLYRGAAENGYYVEGRVEDKTVFSCRFIYGE